jgi:hypothetical protein
MGLLSSAQGCGEAARRRARVMDLGVGAAPASLEQGLSGDTDALVGQLTQLYSVYGGKDGFTRQGLTQVLSKYAVGFRPVIVDLAFALDDNGDGRLTAAEVLDGVRTRLPLMTWVPKGAALPETSLVQSAARTFPDASDGVRDRLVSRLLRFDRREAGGDGDGRLSRRELALPAIVAKVAGQTQFPLQVQGSESDGLLSRVLALRMSQQVVGRYSTPKYSHLPENDLRLEWMSLALDLVYADRVTGHATGVPFEMGAERLAPLLGQEQDTAEIHQDTLTALLRAYDSSAMGGNGDGKTEAGEWWSVLADVSHARALLNITGPLSPAHASALFFGPYLQGHFLDLFPEAGSSYFLDGMLSTPAGPTLWDLAVSWDGSGVEGAADGILGESELALGLARVRSVDSLFQFLDSNHDGRLSRDEAAVLFQGFGVTDGLGAASLFMGMDPSAGPTGALQTLLGLGGEAPPMKPLRFQQRVLGLIH